jgi:TatD DNase family protein
MSRKNPQLLDTHFHLDLYDDPYRIFNEAIRLDIGLIAVTNAPFLFEPCKEICKRYAYAWASLGMHPELVPQYGGQIDQFCDLLDFTNLIGEVGLDFSTKDENHRKMQKTVFSKILSACADKGNKILTIHSRNAVKDVIDMIGDNYPNRILLHWYSGSISNLERAINKGFYFSFNSSMVKSRKGRDIVNRIPLNRILLETDGPFIKCKGKPVTLKVLQKIINSIAEIKGVRIIDIKCQIQKNEQVIYGDIL